jgi:hypothetical protein
VEPLYVASGFALYLNRRTQLEAWDIDLTFRRLRQRLMDAGVALALLTCMSCLPWAAHAADANPAHASTQVNVEQAFHQPLNNRDELFASEATYVYRDRMFGGQHKVSRWVPRQPESPTPVNASFGFFANLASGLFNVLAWALLAVAVVALLVFAFRNIGAAVPLVDRGLRKPETLRSSVNQEVPLPDDLAAATGELWRNGHRREALSLLYRGSVQRAAAALRIQPPVDATEADWLQHASAIDDPTRRERLVAIVRTWQLAAYADRYPGDAEIDVLLSGWPAQRVAS